VRDRVKGLLKVDEAYVSWLLVANEATLRHFSEGQDMAHALLAAPESSPPWGEELAFLEAPLDPVREDGAKVAS
jgi:hypothetical protein